ncbi:MAG: IS110 family transposase [Actinomycetota bacterium]
MLHAGMDMHKRFSVVTVVDDDGKEVVAGRKLENQEEEHLAFFKGLGEEARVVLEAGQNWMWMCDLLDDCGIENILCHPLKTKAIATAKIKTDKLDSRILSQLLRADFIPQSYKPQAQIRDLRELMRYRAFLVRERTKTKNAVHALLIRGNIQHPYSDLFGRAGLAYLEGLELLPQKRFLLDGYLRVLADLTREISRADKRISGEYKASGEARLLATMPGVGSLLSLFILSEIGDISRFHSAKQLSSHAGLVPSTSQSGGTVRHGRITRQGSPWLRWALVEAAIHASRYPGPLRDHYLRLQRRNGNKIARVAVARKMSTYVFHMLTEGKTYEEVISHLKSDLG